MLKYLCQTLKSSPRNPKSMIPISHFQNRKKTQLSNPAIDFILDECADLPSSNPIKKPTQDTPKTAEPVDAETSSIVISHHWPEWVVLMQKLMKNGYFDVVGNPFRSGELIHGKGCNQIRTACLNFARDRPDLMSYLTRGDIHAVAGSGCPSIDRKVVNSGKRLRAHMGIHEGNVCSSCILRGNCERAYVKPREDEGGRTVDVMRFVLTYGLHRLNDSPDNEPFTNKRFEEAIRSLIRDMVKYSKEKLDFYTSKRAPSVQRNTKNRCEFHERLETSGDNWDHVELQRGDWLCKRCSFLNFAKNTRCLQCHTNPPKRQLNPGEWECDSCNYINFRRNTACLKCDHKRPKAFR
ncbi:zinc finger protein VAR3, chloroplastic [Lactuca sativa]|uniref:zinc finger protein VAR3, chloroplastic n=1 Tax=Lactuca sativa TaxID=4236 RepID=UPI000CD9B316|nr:zinc finger protein VAR3, chloroplastic [Lactuca sativa]